MRYVIDSNNQSPAYLQLYRQLRDDIVSGIYPFKSKLPSKRIMADDTFLSIITVEHAYALLCDEGYVESRERSGYFVIFNTDDGFIPASENTILSQKRYTPNSPEFPLSVLTKTMRGVISDYDNLILEKSPNKGCFELRESIRNYIAKSRGITAKTEQIIIGSGAEYLYTLIIELLGRGRTYAVESPSYEKIEQVYSAADVKYEMLPLGNDGIKSSHLWASNADVLHITPYRSFPSGVTATASKRHEYVRWASEKDRYIVEDDFESEFSISKKPEETLFSLSHKSNIIYINTFSKTVSSSLRVGYMVLPEHLVSPFEERLGFYSCTVSTYIQLVLAALISNGDFARHINRVRRKLRKELFPDGRRI